MQKGLKGESGVRLRKDIHTKNVVLLKAVSRRMT